MQETDNLSTVPNFMEEEDYEAPLKRSVPLRTEPEPIEGSDNNSTADEVILPSESNLPKAPKGEHLTELNALYLAFLSKFPGADAEAISVLAHRQDYAAEGKSLLPTVKGITKRLDKMRRIGAIERSLNSTTGVHHYSATEQGINALWSFGYNAEHGRIFDKISKSRANHYRMIAHVAAQFASPEGFFRDSLGIDPVDNLDCLVSENQMIAEYKPIEEMLKKAGKQAESNDYGRWRKTELEAALAEAGKGAIQWSDIVEAHPTLLTIGQPQRTGTETKAVHQPDIAVLRDNGRTGVKAKNLLVEVELSKKSWDTYNSILKTLKMELEHGFIYERAVYFTVGQQVENLLKKIDHAKGYDLFKSGKLTVVPILDRNGTPVRFSNRISLGGSF